MRGAVTGLVLLVVALNGGCSDSDDGAARGGSAAPTTAVSTTTTTAPASDDHRLALDLVVREGDFPPGWSHSQAADEVEDPADRCLKAGPLAAASGRAESAEFAKSDLATASSLALVFPDEAAARAAFAHVTGSETKACIDQALRAELQGEGEGEEGVAVANAVLTSVRMSSIGDETAAYRFSAETSGTDQPYRYSASIVIVRSGRTVTAFAFGNLGDPVPEVEQQTVASRVATRAKG